MIRCLYLLIGDVNIHKAQEKNKIKKIEDKKIFFFFFFAVLGREGERFVQRKGRSGIIGAARFPPPFHTKL